MMSRQGLQLDSEGSDVADASDAARHRLLRAIGAWLDRARRRADLPLLDARMLRDIGVTPDWVEREATKPFWEE